MRYFTILDRQLLDQFAADAGEKVIFSLRGAVGRLHHAAEGVQIAGVMGDAPAPPAIDKMAVPRHHVGTNPQGVRQVFDADFKRRGRIVEIRQDDQAGVLLDPAFDFIRVDRKAVAAAVETIDLRAQGVGNVFEQIEAGTLDQHVIARRQVGAIQQGQCAGGASGRKDVFDADRVGLRQLFHYVRISGDEHARIARRDRRAEPGHDGLAQQLHRLLDRAAEQHASIVMTVHGARHGAAHPLHVGLAPGTRHYPCIRRFHELLEISATLLN